MSTDSYIKSRQIFQCPSETNGPDLSSGQWGISDYWVNRYICGWRYKDVDPEIGINQSSIASSALVVLLGDGAKSDANGTCGDNGRPGYNCYEAGRTNLTGNDRPENRHLEGANYAFADGHVKWLKPGKIGSPSVNTGYSINPNTS